MNLDPAVAAMLRCPACLSAFTALDAPELTCAGCGLVYPIRDGIPILLVDEATRPEGFPAPAGGGE